METNKTVNIPVETVGQAYLEVLRARGVKYFFGNSGTDFGPIIDALAKFGAEKKMHPMPITVPHEFVAVSMAQGYAMITGEPQVVMVHVIVGTGNASAAVMNASRLNVPMIFSAGRTPLTEEGFVGSRSNFIHWGQESFDQGSLLREFTRWDYELRNGDQVETVVDRALEMALGTPQGPVYLTLPREVLAQKMESITIHPNRKAQAEALQPSAASIKRTADILRGATNPLIITGRLGSDPTAVSAMVSFAEALVAPVVTPASPFVSFPNTHEFHLGVSSAPYIKDADVIVVVECDVPWYPFQGKPPENGKVIQIARDPNYSGIPIRNFPKDISIGGDPKLALELLAQELKSQPRNEKASAERAEKIRAEHKRYRERTKQKAEKASRERPIDTAWLSYCVDQVRDSDTLIVNDHGVSQEQLNLSEPASYFGGSPAGGLGWGIGGGLGMKLARPEKTVIVTAGDGTYMFNNPTACHFVSEAYDLPLLTIVCNNAIWHSTKAATQQVMPDGWAVSTGNFPLTALAPSPRYEKVVEAHGGYGEMVDDPQEVLPALKRALKVVKEEKRQAVLNVICGSH
ncbi:MAG: thiamine pyrophosphate enzyme-like TPP-binding protein [Deltaproteobacteria bacterium]|nr:thiamine pyrophosphate enzyme-like TPP-binding protein [Deltaproteobacteria bacterium]